MAALAIKQATADSTGAAVVTFVTLTGTFAWDVEQITVETSPAGATTTCTVRLDGNLITATSTGSGDTASGSPDLTLNPGDNLTVTWAGAPVGSLCTAVLLYDEVPR